MSSKKEPQTRLAYRAASGVQMMLFPGGESVRRQVFIRGGVAAACLLLTTLLVYLGRYGYYDSQNPDEPITFLNAFYFATVSLSTTGYGDIVPATPINRLISAVVITPLRVVFLIVLVGSTLEILTRRTQQYYREKRWRDHVRDHTIVIGYGVKGRSAAQALMDNGLDPDHIVVVSTSQLEVSDAASIGCVGIEGDARRDDVLEKASIATAKSVVVAADSDDKAVLITLNARRLNPKAEVVTAVREAQHAPMLRQSGANAVITTAEAAGRLMGISLISPTAGAIMEDLLDPGEGLEVCERLITTVEADEHVGTLADRGEMVLAIVRDGVTYRFDQPECQTLRLGDRIVEIRHTDRQPRGTESKNGK